MGLALLVLRLQVRESSLFEVMKVSKKQLKRGSLLVLLKPKTLKKYINVILVGAPLWGIVGLLITFSPEFAKDFGMVDIPKAGTAVLFCYVGLVIGDMLSGLISQLLRSRKKAVAIFLGLTTAFTGLFVWGPHDSLESFYGLCLLLGIGVGYWAMFVQMGAEQFGTNIRATAATSIPNMVRGSVIFTTATFQYLKPDLGVTNAGLAVIGFLLVLAFIALLMLKETFGEDLDYTER
jgi:putative MFS transporter